MKTLPVGRDEKRPPILVLVVCPTRELASQAAAEANTLLKYHPSIGVQVVIGGTRLALEQKRMQANPCQVSLSFLEDMHHNIKFMLCYYRAVLSKGLWCLPRPLDTSGHSLDAWYGSKVAISIKHRLGNCLEHLTL